MVCSVGSGISYDLRKQLILFLREWYMHPNGQISAYEFALGDVNPPVHAWAVWRVYKMIGPRGGRDRAFLESAFQKLLLNFTWWVNRKDIEATTCSRAVFSVSITTPNNPEDTEPAFIEPMQCKPVTGLPAGEKWTFEIKLDGYRCIAVKRGSEVTLFSRNEKVLNKRFPTVVDALASPRLRSRWGTGRLRFTRETFLSGSTEQPIARTPGLLLRIRHSEPGRGTLAEFVDRTPS
jgi:ATP dependent DNA ligase domain/Mannosylglycerate hydrolase MGH1-like glycoside hydrolase domain